MQILEKSLKLANSLYRTTQKPHYQQKHFTFLFIRNKLVSVGQNNYRESNVAAKFAHYFNVPQKKKFPTVHSEVDAISRLWGKTYVDKRIRLVNVRILKDGQLGFSRPCSDCKLVLDSLGIQDIFYSTTEGFNCEL